MYFQDNPNKHFNNIMNLIINYNSMLSCRHIQTIKLNYNQNKIHRELLNYFVVDAPPSQSLETRIAVLDSAINNYCT